MKNAFDFDFDPRAFDAWEVASRTGARIETKVEA